MKFLYSLITHKLIAHKEEKGFTLIELLIVTSFIGVLTMIAYPNLLSQIGKSREAETQLIMGTLVRGQQAFHWERGTFTHHLPILGVGYRERYHEFKVVSGDVASLTATEDLQSFVRHKVYAKNPSFTSARNFAIGIYVVSDTKYSISQCQSLAVGLDATVATTPNTACIDGMTVR